MIGIIGAGPAGIETAYRLAVSGKKVVIFDQGEPLGNIRDKALLFPDFSPASELVTKLEAELAHPGIQLLANTKIVDIGRYGSDWTVTAESGETFAVARLVLATGYSTFDARRKEEYGYGIYKGVITSIDLEAMLSSGNIVNSIGDTPARVAFLQCVGSRDMKTGNNYCSKLCCITAAKQAIELRRHLPDAEIFVFYMDLRMWGQGFEEIYKSSQQDYNIHYIRGRISEAAGTFDGKVQIKAEDTLTGFPVRMNADLLVLMVGIEASAGTKMLSAKCGICGDYGFARSADCRLADNLTSERGLYLAGSCKRPMSIPEVISDARSAAIEMLSNL